jgi:hypothetical protein
MRLSPGIRKQFYYTVEKAGSMEPLRWSRTESYRGVDRGDIPVKKRRAVSVGAAPGMGRQN